MVDQQVDPIPSGSTSTVRFEIPSPFYLHPSENASSSLLPGVFDGTGYRSWRRAVLRALSVKSKTGFINGKVVKPNLDDPSFQQWERSWRRAVLRALSVKSKTGFINGKVVKPNPYYPSFQQWERCDDMVTSWILNSLSPDLRDSLQYVNNAQELWAELEERYDQTNGCKLYQLQKELNDLVQGTLDVTGYYTKMKKLWEDMSIVDVSSQCSCVCTCGGKIMLVKTEQDRRLIQFLMGLNEIYTVIRGNILMMSTLPSMAQTFAILSQEEKQREVRPHTHTALDSTSLNALASSTRSKGGPRTNYNFSKGST
ncbi:uncharacterized protein [Solanum tuberosum]|uniref:uncharacterized protein n=1 Tax=Solanum tuberosum TaxID=4113 RepID=UPI00073A107F|nr:PREDICTED: uncharacterized protein LOC107063097 [Solanum tuberosum]